MKLERGTIRRIDARGRVTVELEDRLVVADIHSGSGGCIGDIIEGDMQPGVRSWRNVGTSVLSVVEVLGSEALPTAPAHEADSTSSRAPSSGSQASRSQAPGSQPGDAWPERRGRHAPDSGEETRWPIDRRRSSPRDQYSSRTLSWN